MTRIGTQDLTPVAAAVLTPRGLLLMGCAGMPQRIATEDPWPRFLGTWVHTDYPRRQPYVQQLVNRPDLTGEDRNRPTDSAPDGVWKVRTGRSWTDCKANTYLQALRFCTIEPDGVGSDLWYVIYARRYPPGRSVNPGRLAQAPELLPPARGNRFSPQRAATRLRCSSPAPATAPPPQ